MIWREDGGQMENLPVLDRDESDFLTTNKAMELLWQWRKYRNQVFWSSMYRLGAACMLLTVIPYIVPDMAGRLGIAILVFPILAAVLSVFASYLMVVQYMLYKLTDRKFRSLLGKFNPGDIADTSLNRPFRISIGKVLAGSFLLFGVLGQFLNGLVLAWLVQGARP
jgi:hypothetical protein